MSSATIVEYGCSVCLGEKGPVVTTKSINRVTQACSDAKWLGHSNQVSQQEARLRSERTHPEELHAQQQLGWRAGGKLLWSPGKNARHVVCLSNQAWQLPFKCRAQGDACKGEQRVTDIVGGFFLAPVSE